jgi:putative AdoMet-dependent methyltransferase
MGDLFEEKSKDWDRRDMVLRLSAGVGAAVLEHVPLQADWEVLDFGAGTGLASAQVAPLVSKIVAVDVSQAMLDVLVAKPELAGKVEPVCQDILQRPLGQTFDLVMSAMAMHHVEDTHALVDAFSAHLDRGGMLALADLDAEDGSFHPADIEGVYHSGFDRGALGRLLEQHGFTDVRFVTAHTVAKEERGYPVFLVTAVKE